MVFGQHHAPFAGVGLQRIEPVAGDTRLEDGGSSEAASGASPDEVSLVVGWANPGWVLQPAELFVEAAPLKSSSPPVGAASAKESALVASASNATVAVASSSISLVTPVTFAATISTTPTSAITIKQNCFVGTASQAVSLCSILSVNATSSNPAYLVVSLIDRNDYTKGASCVTGTLTGNGHTLSLSSLSGDLRTAGIVFTWNATTGQYTNATYGNLLNLVYTTSGSTNDLTDLCIFGTNNATQAAAYANSPIVEAVNSGSWTNYGTVTFATQSVGTQLSTTQATPDSVASVALKFVGDVWNTNGDWALANTIDAEAGAALSVTSTAGGWAGVANGEWKVAYNGPIGSSTSWYSSLRTGDQVVYETGPGGVHILTVVSGTGAGALVVDTTATSTNSAKDGSATDILVSAAHSASTIFSSVNPAWVVVYRLDTPVITDKVSSVTVQYGASFALSTEMSASDWAATAITTYQVYDTHYNLTINGTVCSTAHSAATAASCTTLSGISFLATGSSATSDTLYVRAENAAGYWGDWTTLTVGVGVVVDQPTVSAGHAATSVTAGLAYTISTAGDFKDPHGATLTYSATLASGAALPSWMSFNTATGVISGTAGSETSSTAYSITVTATNSQNNTASETFTVTDVLPSAPVFSGISSVSTPGSLVSLLASFTDPNKETLTYTATLASGAALPSWLAINSSTGLLSGTAPASAQVVQVDVTATDTGGASTTKLVTITDTGKDIPQVVSSTKLSSTITAGLAYSLSTAGGFTDPQGETLTYSATLASGAALPSWMSINAATGVISGTAGSESATTAYSITVTVTNTQGNTASETFTVTDGLPPVPVFAGSSSGSVIGNAALSLSAAFTDPDKETLTYTATLASGAALPSWLTINASTGLLSGTSPSAGQTVQVDVTATDAGGASTTKIVTITDTGDIPQVVSSTNLSSTITAGLAYSLSTAGGFTDPQGETLTYSAKLASGAALPSWMSINAATGVISGTAGSESASTAYSITVTVTNTQGNTASETFTVTEVLPPAPVFAGSASRSILGNTALSLSEAFTDPDKEKLTYTATLASGAALPSWLTINASTGLLSGTSPSAAQTVQVDVTATDAGGASTTKLVTITDTGTDVPQVNASGALNYTIYENHTVSINAASIFTDPLGEALTLSTILLPSWLSYNATTGLITGTAPASTGTYTFILQVVNSDGNFATETVNLTDILSASSAATGLTLAQSWWGGTTDSLSLASSAFTSLLGSNLTYSATLASGAALPSWLVLNATTGVLSTVGSAPNAAQTLDLIVKATNGAGTSATSTLAVSVLSSTPTLANQTGNVKIVDGQSVSISLAGVFTDPRGLALTLSATEISGTNASSWLHFNPATDMLTGVLPSSGAGVIGLQITATDTLGLGVTETFGIAYGATTASIPSISASSLTAVLEHIVLGS